MNARIQRERRALIVRRVAARKQSASAKRMWNERRRFASDLDDSDDLIGVNDLPDVVGE